MSTSATGGYLIPLSTSGDLNDDALANFMQQVISGITGLPGSLVRPRWQPEPPDMPSYGTDWAGLGVISRKPDKFAYVHHSSSSPNGFDYIYRQEILEVLCSFYGPNSEKNSELLSVGFQVAQNRETMESQGFGLIEVNDPITAPEIVHERYLRRVDLGFRLRRTQVYTYSVLHLAGLQSTILDDSGAVNVAVLVSPNTKLVTALPLFAWGLSSGIYSGWGKGNWI